MIPDCDAAMATAAAPPRDQSDAVNNMVAHVASSGAFVKSQQRDEDEISMEEKTQIILDIWHRNPVVFLERYNRWLIPEHLECFSAMSDQYEVSFYLKEVRKRLDIARSAVGVRNRRYEAIKKLEKEGKYFSDEEMKARDPLMFEQLIGQYQTEEERAASRGKTEDDETEQKFSHILQTFIDEQEVKELYGRQKDLEDDMMEEEEEDSDEEEEEEEDSEEDDDDDDEDEDGQVQRKLGSLTMQQVDDDEPGTSRRSSKKKRNKTKYDEHGYPIFKDWEPTPATLAEKSLLRQEFLTHMHQRFLSGKENEFDYASVDHNTDYDSLDIRTQDEQERYFDDESVEDVSPAEGGDDSEMEMKTVNKGEEAEEELEEWETFGMDAENVDPKRNSPDETAEVTSPMER